MSKPFKALAIASGVMVIAAATVIGAGGRGFSVGTRLTGYEEVPAISTTGNGSFRGMVSADGASLSYEVSYADLEGAVAQSHIHFAQAGVNGGISIFFCSNLGNGPAGTQACPASPATVSGTVTAADVIGPNGQGISAGEWAEVVAAIRAGATYVNVHSSMFPGGEIRGQLRNSNSSNGN
jgi:CHRD domain